MIHKFQVYGLLLALISLQVSAQKIQKTTLAPLGFRLEACAGIPLANQVDEFADNGSEVRQKVSGDYAFGIGGNIPMYRNMYIYIGSKLSLISHVVSIKTDFRDFQVLEDAHELETQRHTTFMGLGPRIALGYAYKGRVGDNFFECGYNHHFFSDSNWLIREYYSLNSSEDFKVLEMMYTSKLRAHSMMPSIDLQFGKILKLGFWGKLQTGVQVNWSTGNIASGFYRLFPNTIYEKYGNTVVSGSYAGLNVALTFHRQKFLKSEE